MDRRAAGEGKEPPDIAADVLQGGDGEEHPTQGDHQEHIEPGDHLTAPEHLAPAQTFQRDEGKEEQSPQQEVQRTAVP